MDACKQVPVTQISVWLQRNCQHEVSSLAIEGLLAQAQTSAKMQVYVSGIMEGRLDAYADTPNYINGQEDVFKLILDGNIIWEKPKRKR
jgi:hypothetical protein